MTVTPTYTGAVPTVGADFDSWGGELNDGLGDIATDLAALAAQGNAAEPLAANAYQKSGGTITGNVVITGQTTLADVATGEVFAAGFRGVPIVSINVDRTLIDTDSGKAIRFFGGTARTLTIPTNAAVGWPPSTVIAIRNYLTGANTVTVTPSPGVTLTVVGSLTAVASATVQAGGWAFLVKEDTNIWFIVGAS